MSLQRISFAEACAFSRAGEGTFFGSNGLLQTAAAGVPRFDYDPVTLAPKGILIEGGRTNLFTYPADTTNAVWIAQRSVKSAASSDLGLSFTKVTETSDADAGVHGIFRAQSGGVAGQIYSVTRIVRQGNSPRLRLAFTGPAFGGSPISIVFNFSTGVFTSPTGAMVGWGARSLGSGLWLIWASAAATVTDSIWTEVQIDNGSSFFYQGTGTYYFDLAVSILENGAFPSSYTPGTTMAVTRAADILTVQPAQFAAAFRQDAGTILIDMTLNHTGLTATGGNDFPFLLDMDSAGASADGYRFVASAGYGPGYKIEVTTSGSLVAGPTFAKALGGGSRTKLALSWGGANDFAACMDGGAVATDTSGAIPTPDRLSIGCQDGSGNQMFGHVRKVLFFPQRLTNAQLQEATA